LNTEVDRISPPHGHESRSQQLHLCLRGRGVEERKEGRKEEGGEEEEEEKTASKRVRDANTHGCQVSVERSFAFFVHPTADSYTEQEGL
jgi:hypothetical protein